MGLEVNNFSFFYASFHNVEIRPRWDWKDSLDDKIKEAIIKLKSDQDGIGRLCV